MLTVHDFLYHNKEQEDIGIVPGNELFNYTRFRLNNHVWKYAYINRNYIDINDLQLPWDSIYHTLDNLEYQVQQDTPRINTDPFIKNESYRKWILHITDFDLKEPITFEQKHTYITSMMRTNLLSFRSEQKNKFRYIENIDSIMAKKESLTILNYNPLFRVYTYGALQFYNKITLILTTLLNTLAKVMDKFPNKHQYICIPWDNNVFSRDVFMRSKIKIDNTSVKFQNNFHYIFMMHLLNFLDDSPTSIFKDYPELYWGETNFILKNGNKCTILNLKDLKELNAPNNRAYLRIINHLNTLSLFGVQNISGDNKTDSNKKDIIWNDNVPVITDTNPLIPLSGLNTLPPQEVIDETTYVEESKPLVQEIIIEPVSKKPVITDTKESIKKNISPTIAPNITNPLSIENKPIGIITTEPRIQTSVSLVPNMAANITKVNPQIDPVEIKNRTKNFITDLDKEAEEYINKQEDITPKQKERLKAIAKKYKQLTIEDENIQDILLKNNDVTISSGIAEDITKELPDQSMRKSTVLQFDKSYLEKTLKKDLVSTAISFSKNGMFLVDIKSETILNELTHATRHVFTYEDKNGKKHKIDFSVPIVDTDGYCYINGVKKLLKKQMVNIPICKIGPDRVSINSNYNKVLVQRNVTKAHSYITLIDKLIEENKQHITVTFGTLDLNLPLAYDYTTIAKKYQLIHLRKDDNDVYLCFDYYNRYKLLLGDKENQLSKKIHALELTHGLFFGKVNNNFYLFIDINNEVTHINIASGGIWGNRGVGLSSTPTTIASLFSFYNKNFNKVSFITEWVDLNLVSKPLPIGFVLAYRYGLTKTLEHLGVSYKLIAKRGSKVVEETSEIVGAEALVEDKYIYTPGDIVIKFKDVNLIFNRYPLAKSLIISGLDYFNTQAHEFNEFDTKDVYYQLMVDRGIKVNYLKAVDSFFDLFIDPITQDILEQMGEPTNVRDLLIRATVLLTTCDHKEASSIANHRIRSYEQFNAIIYNEMSRALASFHAGRGKGNVFSVNPNAIYLRIIQNPSFIIVEDINPIQELKDKTSITFAGMGGRTSESFVIEDRKYPSDGVGVLSEATVDNQKVAMNACLSVDPSLINTRGLIADRSLDKLDPTNILSITALTMPCSTNDDGMI